MRLVIAEKPSVARSIAAVLGAAEQRKGYLEGGGWRVSWCFGHLAAAAKPEDYDPAWKKWRLSDLPLIPAPFRFMVTTDAEEQFSILKKLLHDADTTEVVNACDAGREGELIFRNVYELTGCTIPMKRLWISSMEDAAIRDGFNQLRDGADYDGLHRASVCRAEADWLVGINGSRFFSLVYDARINVGRVMSPTLALLVQREADIDAFTPTPFWRVTLDLGEFIAETERLDKRQTALELAEACTGTATVLSVERKEKSEKAPPLYDLTALQRDANRILGYTAQQTLDYLQALYEKKLCTYPRTDARYLTDDMERKVPDHAAIAAEICGQPLPNSINAKQVCDSKKVSDHHALIPTLSATAEAVDALPLGECAVLRLVSSGLLRAVSEPHRYAETVAEFTCAGAAFTAKGKTVLIPGWKLYECKPETEEPVREKDKPNVLPELANGQALAVRAATVKAGKTSPPKHYTEDTVLASMETAGVKDMPEDVERKGLGTPATRAAILEKLISAGYIERQKAKKVTSLMPTAPGKALISILPEALQSPLLTAEWEYKLKEIERGELDPGEFIRDINNMLRELIHGYKPTPGSEMLFPRRERRQPESLGKCPCCGKSVIEIDKGFVCSDRKCDFAIWKASHFFTNKQITPTADMIRLLLHKGRMPMKGCYSEKSGKTYDAVAVLIMKDGKPDFELEFANRNRRE